MTVNPVGELLPFFDRHRIVLDVRLDGQSTWTLRVLNRVTGDEYWKVGGLPAAYYLNTVGTNSLPFAFACGHTLYLHLNNFVFALDLAERREIWRYNLYGKDILLNTGQNSLIFDHNVGLMIATDQEKRTNIGRIAVVESGYVALQTKDGLVVVDPTRPGPSVLWMKTDVLPKAQVFGDDRNLFVYDAEAKGRSRCCALRVQDGAVVPVADFTEHFQKKVQVISARLLLMEPGGKAVRLYDVRQAKDIWRREFAANSIIAREDDPKRVAIIEPGGLFTLLDGRTGDVAFTSRLQPNDTEKLQEATLLSDHDRYYIALNRASDRGFHWNSAAGFAIRSARVNGAVYALNRRTGKLEWISDFVPHHSLLLEQWNDLPVLLLAAQYTKSTANGVPERQGVKVTAINKATGKLILDDEIPQTSQFHAINANLGSGRVELIRQDMKVVFVTPEAAAQPEPTAPPSPARPAVQRAAIPIAPPAVLPPLPVRGGQ
jgi:outer membrane protein assembly factor BamB